MIQTVPLCGKGAKVYKKLRKQKLIPTVTLMETDAPCVARKAQAGQFIILRVDAEG